MAEPPKPEQAHPYPFPPPGYNGSPYPHPHMPPFFAYPPQPDAAHPDPQNPGPFMIGLPPGVVYAYPPHPQPPRASCAPLCVPLLMSLQILARRPRPPRRAPCRARSASRSRWL